MKKRRFFSVLGEYCYFGNTYRVLSKFCKMTFAKQIFKSELAHCLVNYDCDGVGEIERAGMFAGHGNAKEIVRIAFVQLRGKSAAFTAEDERIAIAKRCFVQRFGAFCREEKETFRFGVGQKGFPIFVHGKFRVLENIVNGSDEILDGVLFDM